MPFLRTADRRRRWKVERASVHRRKATRPRSNKYSGGDREALPKPHRRKLAWVGGYKRANGKKIKGYFRTNSQYRV